MNDFESKFDNGIEMTVYQPGELATVTSSQPKDQNPAAVYLARLSISGRRTMRQALNLIAGMLTNGRADCLSLDWSKIGYQHAAAVRAQLVEHYAAATSNKILCALRGVLKEAWKLGLIKAEDYQKAAAVESVTGTTIPAGRELQPGELSALMSDCYSDNTPAGARDAAIIALSYATGLRRHELVGLDLASYDQVTGKLVVLGKRNKERTAYLTNGAKDALSDWLQLRGPYPGPLFLVINKGGKISHSRINKADEDTQGRMSPQAIYNLLVKRAGLAGVKHFSPHDLRRSFVSDLLEAGADIATVSKMAGHASVITTARYDRRPEQAKQKAAGLLSVPYRKRRT